MKIVSASRRTDIPAFYSEWLLNRLAAGFVLVPNPFNPRQIGRISLRPKDVAAVIFVTKNPRPMLQRLRELERLGCTRYLFQVTLTGLPKSLEPHVPDAAAVIADMRELAEKLGPDRIIWRFDPVVLTDGVTAADTVRRFRHLAEKLEGSVRQVLFSVVREYRQVRHRMGEFRGKIDFTNVGDLLDDGTLSALAATARRHGMELLSCADGHDLTAAGIGRGRCIDASMVNRLFSLALPLKKASGQRSDCTCHASADIGIYGTCPHGCLYCYACTDEQLRRHCHDPESPMLIGSPPPEEQPGLF